MERVTNEELAKKIKEGEAVQENYTILWNNNRRLIQIIITELTGLKRSEDGFQDMEQQSFIGLMEAVQSFDESKGAKLFTHAKTYIRKSLYRYYDNGGYSIRIPSYMKTRIKRYGVAKRELTAKGEAKLDDESIREKMGISYVAYRQVVNAITKMGVDSLDKLLKTDEEESGSVIDMIPSLDDVECSATESVYLQELHRTLFKALDSVSCTGREIIISHYFQGHSISHIGRVRGCTTQNVINHMKLAYKTIRMGRQGKELTGFLMEKSAIGALKSINNEMEIAMSEEERELLL